MGYETDRQAYSILSPHKNTKPTSSKHTSRTNRTKPTPTKLSLQIDARALKVNISDNENMDGRDSDMDSNSPLIVDSGLQNTSVRLTPYQSGKRVASPSPCAICCTIFSIIGAVILTLVASYIGSGSKYIIVDKDPENIDMEKRGKMALHMYIAAGMYVGTSLIAGFYWRNPRVKVE